MRKLLTLLFVLLPAATAHGFICSQTNGHCFHWASGAVTLQSQFPPLSNPPLINGTTTWDQNSMSVANDWNGVGAAFRFTVNVGGPSSDPCACPNPGGNPIIFDDNACGRGFGDIIAQTNQCFNENTGELFNASVFVSRSASWNGYDGTLRPPVNDIRRVLLHEFGHVLGLAHPDDHGQTVAAIMNKRESNLDRLQQDDINGIFSIYNGSGGSSGSAPPPTTNACQLADPARPSGGWALLLPLVIAPLRLIRRRRSARSRSR